MIRRTIIVALFTLGIAPIAALACDGKAVIEVNPVTGNSERLCSVWDGHDYEIEWSEKTTGWSTPIRLTDDLADDVAPDLAFDQEGNTGAVWRNSSSGTVLYRHRTLESGRGTWSEGSVPVSSGLGNASAPRLSFDADGSPWVGWHEVDSSGSVSVMGGEGDAPTPWPMTFVSSPVGNVTEFGKLELDMKIESGEKWVVWIDSAEHLAYAVWNEAAAAWGGVILEPYSGPGDVDPGKERVREQVLP